MIVNLQTDSKFQHPEQQSGTGSSQAVLYS